MEIDYEYFEEREPVNASPEKAFHIIKDVLNLPKWSGFIRSVVPGLDGWHMGVTVIGPVHFRWDADEAEKKVTMTYNLMGFEISSYFQVLSDGAHTIVSARWPMMPYADDEVLEMSQIMGREELRRLVRLIEKTPPGSGLNI